MSPEALTLLSLFAATFVSEDLACVSAGLLIQRGDIDPTAGVVACGAGIAVGDVALWALGRVFGEAALRWRWVAPHLRGQRFAHLSGWLTRHAAAAIVGSRFVPGTRLPTYVLSGFMGIRATTFMTWTIVGAAVWTPFPVLLSKAIGDLLAAASTEISSVSAFGVVALSVIVIRTLRRAMRIGRRHVDVVPAQ